MSEGQYERQPGVVRTHVFARLKAGYLKPSLKKLTGDDMIVRLKGGDNCWGSNERQKGLNGMSFPHQL